MNTRYWIAMVVLGTLALLAGCRKEQIEIGIPEGALMLKTEGYSDAAGGQKITVKNQTVQWEEGDGIALAQEGNSWLETVYISGSGKAYVEASGEMTSGAPVWGYCPDEGSWSGMPSTTPTFKARREYSCNMTGGRQHISGFPVVAYHAQMGNALMLRHVTAAVKVMLWNALADPLTVDSVIVRTATYRINGNVTVDLTDTLAAGTLGMAASYASLADSDRMVKVSFPSSGEGALVIPAGNQSMSVQVPILPIESDGMTIEVYCHAGEIPYLYTYTEQTPALARNVLLTARVKLDIDGHMPQGVDLSTITTWPYTPADGAILYGEAPDDVHITIADGNTVILYNANITVPDDNTWAGITCEGDAVIRLYGTNTVQGGKNSPGIYVPSGSTLTIGGYGSLAATGRGGVTGSAPRVSYSGGAGIGGGSGSSKNGGNIVITGGTIDATGGAYAAGIGGGCSSNCGDITISGGIVRANGTNAAGIGGGYYSGLNGSSSCGDITISGGTVVSTASQSVSGTKYGAGIGAGASSLCGNITITGGNVTATGGMSGIGSSSSKSNTNSSISNCGHIEISGGTVSATAGSGTGISTGNSTSDITISGGNVTATGASIGAGIGGLCGNIEISGGTVTATGAGTGAGIGGQCGNIVILGGTVTATASATNSTAAAGIGIYGVDNISCGDITISSNVVSVTAIKAYNPNFDVDANVYSIGKASTRFSNQTCGTVTIGGTVYYDGTSFQNGGGTYLAASPLVYTPTK